MADVRFLNQALRELSASLATAGRPLPPVQLANLTESGLELRLAEPAPGRPAAVAHPARRAGLVGGAHGRRRGRQAGRGGRRGAVPGAGDGRRRSGRTPRPASLLDLEASGGVISVGGEDAMRRAVLAAMAVELLTNTWSDKMTVTLVGFAGDLSSLAPGRVHQTSSLEEVLPGLETELAERRRGLADAGLDSVLAGRLGMVGGAGWPPHFIISATPVSGQTAARLARVIGDPSRLGIGYLIAGDVPGAAWKAAVDDAGRLRLPALGLEVTAQRLPDDQYASVLELFEATRDLNGEPILPLTAEAAALEAQLRLTPTVSVRLLGDLEVTGAYGELDEDRVDQAAEALTFLMLHRDGVHPRVLTSALFPRGAANDIGDQVLHRLGTWLGVAPDGTPNLVTLPDGRLTVSQSVRSDWEMFKNMRALADLDPRYQDARNRDQVLGQALGLVRGSLLAHREAEPLRLAGLRIGGGRSPGGDRGHGRRTLRTPPVPRRRRRRDRRGPQRHARRAVRRGTVPRPPARDPRHRRPGQAARGHRERRGADPRGARRTRPAPEDRGPGGRTAARLARGTRGHGGRGPRPDRGRGI